MHKCSATNIKKDELQMNKELSLIPIPGVHSDYLADVVNGRIWSEKSQMFLKNSSGNKRFGYVYQTVKDTEGHWMSRSLHSLIYSAQMGTTLDMFYERGLEVNHIDGNKTNNRIDNLQLTTRKGQYDERTRALLGKFTRLTEEDVLEIREAHAETELKESQFVNEMADKYEKHPLTIYNIVTYRTWRNIAI